MLRVHLESNDRQAELMTVVEMSGAGVLDVATTVLRWMPREYKPVKASARLFIGGEGLILRTNFRCFENLLAATVHVTAGSASRRVTVVLVLSVGTSMLVGLLMVRLGISSSASETKTTFGVAGGVLGGVGGAGLLTGGAPASGHRHHRHRPPTF